MGSPLTREEWEQRVPELFAVRFVRRAGYGEQDISRVPSGHREGSGGEHGDYGLAAAGRRAWPDGEPVDVRRDVRSTIRTVRPEDVTVRKPPTPAGEVAEVDLGRLDRWFDHIDQRWRTVWAFVMTLAYSRMPFVQPVIGCDQASWVVAAGSGVVIAP